MPKKCSKNAFTTASKTSIPESEAPPTVCARLVAARLRGTSNLVDELHNRDIDHQVKYCNCGTSAGFSTDETMHLSLATTGVSTASPRTALWNLRAFEQFALCVLVSVASQECPTLCRRTESEVLPLQIGEDWWSSSCMFTGTSTGTDTSALPSICIPPWAGGVSHRRAHWT